MHILVARVLVLIVLLLPSAAAALTIEAEWTWLQGPGQRSGDFQLRLHSGRLGALRWTFPESALLPTAQILLLDGGEILAWTEPEGAPGGLDPDDRRLAFLRRLGPGFIGDLFQGRDLGTYFEEAGEESRRGWTRVEGRLGGSPACLVHSRGRARSLEWSLPTGEMQFRWSRSPRRGEHRLLIIPEDGGKLLIEWEKTLPGPVEPAALFFRGE